MIPSRKIFRATVLAVVCGAALYAATYLLTSHSDAFHFAEQTVRRSSGVRTLVGEIAQIRPAFLGPHHQELMDSDAWASMAIDVIGDKNSIELDVTMRKVQGAWSIEAATLDGNAFNLD